jgi:prevent-host-death family protein
MNIKFFQDVVTVAMMKANPAKVIHQVKEANRPVLLTSHGKSVAIVQSIADYESQAEEMAFMRAVVEGLGDVKKGRTLGMAEARLSLA